MTWASNPNGNFGATVPGALFDNRLDTKWYGANLGATTPASSKVYFTLAGVSHIQSYELYTAHNGRAFAIRRVGSRHGDGDV